MDPGSPRRRRPVALPLRSAPVPLVAIALVVTSALRAGFDCPSFRRGDSNTDGSYDISDPVKTLVGLFLGAELPCEKAADADDSGVLDVADAIFSLQYLFLNGEPPPHPGPRFCGGDWTPDELGCERGGACRPAEATRDLSDFRLFRFEQLAALGFCPRPASVYCATVASTEEGYLLELSVQADPPGTDFLICDGVASSCSGDCGTIQRRDARLLDSAEVAAMRQVFESVLIISGPDPICNCIAIDPCRIDSYSWDELTAAFFECSATRIGPQSQEAIQAFLASLL